MLKWLKYVFCLLIWKFIFLMGSKKVKSLVGSFWIRCFIYVKRYYISMENLLLCFKRWYILENVMKFLEVLIKYVCKERLGIIRD